MYLGLRYCCIWSSLAPGHEISERPPAQSTELKSLPALWNRRPAHPWYKPHWRPPRTPVPVFRDSSLAVNISTWAQIAGSAEASARAACSRISSRPVFQALDPILGSALSRTWSIQSTVSCPGSNVRACWRPSKPLSMTTSPTNLTKPLIVLKTF